MIDLYLVKRNVRKKRNSDTYVVEIEGEVFGHVNGKDSFWRAERLEEDKRVIDPVLWGRDFNTPLLTGGWFISKEGAVDYLVMQWVYFDMEPKLLRYAKEEAEEYSAVVIDANEAYTSKTCSYCGNIQNIGSKKRMRCSCGVDVDRDHQGARGIFLRALSVTTSSHEGLCLAGVQHLLAKM